MYLKQYFVCSEFKRGNFKSHLTLFFGKIHPSCVDFGLNHMSLMNPLPPSQNIVTQYCSFLFVLVMLPSIVMP